MLVTVALLPGFQNHRRATDGNPEIEHGVSCCAATPPVCVRMKMSIEMSRLERRTCVVPALGTILGTLAG